MAGTWEVDAWACVSVLEEGWGVGSGCVGVDVWDGMQQSAGASEVDASKWFVCVFADASQSISRSISCSISSRIRSTCCRWCSCIAAERAAMGTRSARDAESDI